MSKFNTVRAWKDEEYRLSLSQADRDLLPEHPAGATELSDDELAYVSGALPQTESWHGPAPKTSVTMLRL